MPTKRTRISRRAKAQDMDPGLLAWFKDAAPRPAMFFFMAQGELQAAWNTSRDAILDEWVQTAPGTRPTHWWKFDAHEQRRRLGGTGTPAHEVTAHVPFFELGIPVDWAADYDPNDPPVFETEAAFLKRHKLLVAGDAKLLSK